MKPLYLGRIGGLSSSSLISIFIESKLWIYVWCKGWFVLCFPFWMCVAWMPRLSWYKQDDKACLRAPMSCLAHTDRLMAMQDWHQLWNRLLFTELRWFWLNLFSSNMHRSFRYLNKQKQNILLLCATSCSSQRSLFSSKTSSSAHIFAVYTGEQNSLNASFLPVL